MPNSIQEVGSKLVEVFGLKGQRVTELVVRAAVGETPTISVTRNLLDAGEIRAETQVFDIGLMSPPAAPTWQQWLDAEAARLSGWVNFSFACLTAKHAERFDAMLKDAQERSKKWEWALLCERRNAFIAIGVDLDA